MEYGYYKEAQGYSVWTLKTHTGDKADMIGHVRSAREAEALISWCLNQDCDWFTEIDVEESK